MVQGSQRFGLGLTRRRIYLILFWMTLASFMCLALLSLDHPSYRPRAPHVLVLCFAILAAAGLAWIGARPAPYTAGLVCLLAAIIGFWIASPNGGPWAAYITRNPDLSTWGGSAFAYAFLFLFPLGWVLLAGSIDGWVRASLSYLATGLSFVLLHIVLLGGVPAMLVPVYVLFWPHFTLAMLGTFGWASGPSS
jgi:hypothetical protein